MDVNLESLLLTFPGLLNATKVQREHFMISGGGGGIHRDDVPDGSHSKQIAI